MSIARAIKHALALPDNVVRGYLADLSDEDMLVRPVEGANHIAWQLGHLIASEHQLIEMVFPGKMPALPEGFAERHTTETSKSDAAEDFLTKDEYLARMDEQRQGTLSMLDRLSDEQLEEPAPDKIQQFAPTVGALFFGQATHWMMHAGQWAIVRRKLGRAPLF